MLSEQTHLSRRAIFILAILSLLVTLVALAWSFERGRLQYEIDYEDVITHIDGLKRWRNLSEGGAGELITGYVNKPPHAPLHSLMAAMAFALVGPQDWAPYAMSGILVFFFLLLIWREVVRFGFPGVALALMGAIFVPVVYQSVHQFRPDFPCAIATLWGMVLFPRWGQAKFGRMAAFSGAMFGLALLAKPPFFPYILAMGFLPWFLTVVAGVKEGRSIQAVWPTVVRTWPFFVACAVVAGPHYAIAWKSILEYIQLNQFGDSAHIWKMTGGLDFQLIYHLAGYSGQLMFGKSVWVLLAIAGGGVLLVIARRATESEVACRLARLLGLAVWAWVFIAWNPHMNPFFGLTFQYALVLAAMVSVAWGSQLAWRGGFPARCGILIPGGAVAAIGVAAFPMIDYRPEFTTADTRTRTFAREIPSEVLASLEHWRQYSDSGYTLLSTYGLLSSHRLQWMANKARLDFRFYAVPYWDVEKQVKLFDLEAQENHRVDFAFLAEPGALGVYEDLPNSDTSGGVLEWIKKSDEYELVDSFPTPSGKFYHLFMALPNFSDFVKIKGLDKKSAPLPIGGAPVVMQVLASIIELQYDSPSDGSARLELALRGQPPASELEVLVNGERMGSVPVTQSASFPESEVSISLRKGLNDISLMVKAGDGNEISNPRMQIRRIRITPYGDASPMQDIVRKATAVRLNP